MRINCPLCKGEIVGKEPACTHCGYAFPVVHPPVTRDIARVLGFILLLAVLVLGAAWGLYRLRVSLSHAPAPEKQVVKELPVLSADSLYLSYHANKVAADAIYKDKSVRVVGLISETGGDDPNGRYIVLGGQGLQDGVQCFLAEDSHLTNSMVGIILTVKGRVDGSGTNVVLRGCRLP